MSSREEQMDDWIIQDGLERERRRRVIPSTTDQIVHQSLGSGLDAMAKVALWLGDHPELPIVELGQIDREGINITFSAEVDLPEPFYLRDSEDQAMWGIHHSDALQLATGNTYGHQTAALTTIGNTTSPLDPHAGPKLLLNTNRWQILGSVGVQDFTTALMIGQAMEQATTPWASEHHIWLVGYGELGEKMVRFLADYHREDRFHLRQNPQQIDPEELAEGSHTIYVSGSTPETLQAFETLKAPNVGMFTDTVVTEAAMFIAEDADGKATVVNAAEHGVRILPNLIGTNHRLYRAMEINWQKIQEEAEQARREAENLTVEGFMETPTPTGSSEQNLPEGNTPAFTDEELAQFLEQSQEEDKKDPLEPTTDEDPAPSAVEEAEEDQSTVPEQPETEEEPTEEKEQHPAPDPQNTPEQKIEDPEPAQSEEAEPELTYELSLLGAPRIIGSEETTGKPAEIVAFLQLTGEQQDSEAISSAIWPGDDTSGNTARTRRSRAARKIKQTLGEQALENAEAWTLPTPLTTDLEQVLKVLDQPLSANSDPRRILQALELIKTPLNGCEPWAEPHRQRAREQLEPRLKDLTDVALETDHFEIAKAARAAAKNL